MIYEWEEEIDSERREGDKRGDQDGRD